MKWALVSNTTTNVYVQTTSTVEYIDGTGTPYNVEVPSTSLVSKPSGTITDILEYDGVSTYTPESNVDLQQVADSKLIGESAV